MPWALCVGVEGSAESVSMTARAGVVAVEIAVIASERRVECGSVLRLIHV